MVLRIASCSCGQLKVTCEGDPVRVSICCCGACQKRTGSVYGVGAYFPQAQVTSIAGREKTFMRTSDAGRWLRSRFCPECGSTVYWEAEFRPGIIGVAIGALADAEDLQPVAVIWTKRKHAWAPIPTDIPAHETQP